MLRAYADNVVVQLEALPQETSSGIALPQAKADLKGHRTARVLAVGPGHYTRLGKLIPTDVKVGERVVLDAYAGQNYDMDLTVPRHNKSSEFQELLGDKGDFRIIREDEILGVVED